MLNLISVQSWQMAKRECNGTNFNLGLNGREEFLSAGGEQHWKRLPAEVISLCPQRILRLVGTELGLT